MSVVQDQTGIEQRRPGNSPARFAPANPTPIKWFGFVSVCILFLLQVSACQGQKDVHPTDAERCTP